MACRPATSSRSGGIGRRAWFRSMYPQGCGGSSPFFGTSLIIEEDRKSTRLNSSDANISYAVFCVKKKKHRGVECDRRPDQEGRFVLTADIDRSAEEGC